MGYVNRIQSVLAETANSQRIGGHTSWDDSDFYVAAKKFVDHLYTVILLGEDIGVTSRRGVYDDMMELLEWDVPDEHKDAMVEAGLDELYSEFAQEDE